MHISTLRENLLDGLTDHNVTHGGNRVRKKLSAGGSAEFSWRSSGSGRTTSFHDPFRCDVVILSADLYYYVCDGASTLIACTNIRDIICRLNNPEPSCIIGSVHPENRPNQG